MGASFYEYIFNQFPFGSLDRALAKMRIDKLKDGAL
jgi:hypothetical protein